MALENVGGRQTFFGVLPTKNKFGGKINSSGATKEIRYSFNFDDIPATDDGNAMVISIPAGAKIVASDLRVVDAWIGGTSLAIGLTDQDDTANDPDGLHAAIATASLTAGSLHVGAGTLIGIVGDATADQVVTAALIGTYTAGSADLIVTYLPFGADDA